MGRDKVVAAATEELLESLERALAEVEALQAMYDTAFTIISPTETFAQAQRAVACGRFTDDNSSIDGIRIDVNLNLSSLIEDNEDSSDKKKNLQLALGLPPGYPELRAAEVGMMWYSSSRNGSGWATRAAREHVTEQLQDHANTLIGQEAIMDLVQELQNLIRKQEEKNHQSFGYKHDNDNGEEEPSHPGDKSAKEEDETESLILPTLGRRWIWVHHITDTARRKSILQQAREHNLGGFLKHGYPGIIVVEGQVSDCNDFVSWVKGSKSRPGGFGRNWGHHCRGEINYDNVNEENSATAAAAAALRKLPLEFQELEDMRDLGAACRESGVEDEFLAYVMQHN